jgi:hypothetical protein
MPPTDEIDVNNFQLTMIYIDLQRMAALGGNAALR